jgi:hypothetical protein
VKSKLLAEFVQATASVEGVNVAGTLVLYNVWRAISSLSNAFWITLQTALLRWFCICSNLRLSGCAS